MDLQTKIQNIVSDLVKGEDFTAREYIGKLLIGVVLESSNGVIGLRDFNAQVSDVMAVSKAFATIFGDQNDVYVYPQIPLEDIIKANQDVFSDTNRQYYEDGSAIMHQGYLILFSNVALFVYSIEQALKLRLVHSIKY